MRKNWKLNQLALIVASLGFLHGCSCGEAATQRRSPLLDLELPADPSGAADYLLDFGQVPLGSRARLQAVVRNRGGSPLTFEVSASSLPFAQEFPTTVSVGVGQRRPIGFTFRPGEAVEFEQILRLETNEEDRRSPARIRLVGRGVEASLRCDPNPLDLGRLLIGEEREASTLCRNTMDIPLTLGEVELLGDAGQVFSFLSGGFVAGDALAPGGEVELTVRFLAKVLGESEATLALRNEDGAILSVIELQAAAIQSRLALEPEGCLDFGFVGLGERRELALQLRNAGDEELVLDEVLVSDSPVFEAVGTLPLPIERGEGRAPFLFGFEPAVSGVSQATVELSVRNERGVRERLSTCLQGFGGGPSLECSPAVIDFGQVAIGSPIVRRKRCIHRLEAPEGEELRPLFLQGISIDGATFDAEIRNEDGSRGPKEEGYLPDESFWIEVQFAPTAEEFSDGVVRVSTTVGVDETRVAGQGRQLPPCVSTIVPANKRLNFGVVNRGAEKVLEFSVLNQGESTCLINDLRLADESHPDFHLDPIESLELDAGELLTVEVKLAPSELGLELNAAVDFWISDPAAPRQRISLRGEGATPCLLLEPHVLDFGVLPPVCQSASRALTLRNLCGRQISIESIEIDSPEQADRFRIVRRPPLPRILEPNWMDEVLIAYHPDRPMPQESASLLVEVRYPETGLVEHYASRLQGSALSGASRSDHFIQKGKKKVDILFVIDNSRSMGEEQVALRERLPSFLDVAQRIGVDFHLAVTSSGTHTSFFVPPPCPGGGFGGENGRFFPVDGSSPRILKADTVGLEDHWKKNIMVGACVNAAEQLLDAGRMALSHPLINEAKDSRLLFNGWYEGGNQFQDGNKGFLREDADLSVIFVSDSIDYSRDAPEAYLSFFLGLKGYDRSRVKIHGITGPAWGEVPCSGTQFGDRYLHLISSTGGAWLDICTPLEDERAWSDGLWRIGAVASDFVSTFVLGAYPADREGKGWVDSRDLEVRVNDVLLSQAGSWRYDPITNAVIFSENFIPPAGASITITYLPSCGP